MVINPNSTQYLKLLGCLTCPLHQKDIKIGLASGCFDLTQKEFEVQAGEETVIVGNAPILGREQP